jgi:hypothetical protein
MAGESHALVFALCLAAGCAPREPPSSAVIVRTSIDSARLACQLYAADLDIPRDAAVDSFCESLKCQTTVP